ncbi:hypothetical protein GCM10010965_15070 [Caldalkalibacillus thermarum]|uniref:hypothetical protein n=1 Tax=Caldalkalibacillus thermarum TaxID=296745 RepID=UPI001663681C|nr:hypothetical protein [Caldalkalibacillus thermarum]GGK23248.1 hypothetical protein GCM10010965_15070 [Caldalkalibacillus thermarum]
MNKFVLIGMAFAFIVGVIAGVWLWHNSDTLALDVERTYSGDVTGIENNKLSVVLHDGTKKTFVITDETKYQWGTELREDMSLDDIEPDMFVNVWAEGNKVKFIHVPHD